MTAIELDVLGIGAWSSNATSWPARKSMLAGRGSGDTATRPLTTLLPPAERRRAPDGVSVALAVAEEALDAARTVACPVLGDAGVASVFASAHGDLAIVDYLCAALASDPFAVSPTKFHLSVHNAAAGNWSIATHDRAPSTSIAAGDDSVALGLLEAATIAHVERRPVLFVAFDTPATGLLVHAVDQRVLSGCALVVAPTRATTGTLCIVVEPSPSATGRDAAASLLAALAHDGDSHLRWPIGAETTLSVTVRRP